MPLVVVPGTLIDDVVRIDDIVFVAPVRIEGAVGTTDDEAASWDTFLFVVFTAALHGVVFVEHADGGVIAVDSTCIFLSCSSIRRQVKRRCDIRHRGKLRGRGSLASAAGGEGVE